LERRIYDYSAEMERLTVILTQNGDEMEQWRQRNAQLQ
jgi:hypothetical protein